MKKVIMTICLLLITFMYANQPAILFIQQHKDINAPKYTKSKISTKLDILGEVFKAHKELGFTLDNTFLKKAVNYINAQDSNTSFVQANKILLNKKYDFSTKAKAGNLLAFANEDGGYGDLKAQSSSIINTALALKALSFTDKNEPIKQSINFLISKQRTDGSWGENDKKDSIYLTSLCLKALQLFKNQYNLNSYIINAQNYLKNNLSNDLELHVKAQVLLALIPLEQDNSFYKPYIDYIKSLQLPNGSWENDLYTTALVLRVLNLASSPFSNPDLCVLKSKVIDADTNTPLDGVIVKIQSKTKSFEAKTDKSGSFVLKNVSKDNYILKVIYKNYIPFGANLQVSKKITNLNTIRLERKTNSMVSILKGNISDEISGEVIDEVQISLGDFKVLSDEEGNYVINNIPQGAYLLSIHKKGYAPITQNIQIEQTTVLNFNAKLKRLDLAINAKIYGKIVDELSLVPLENVEINLVSNQNTIYKTKPDGKFTFEDVKKGNYTLKINKDGYYGLYSTFNIKSSQTIDYGIIKLKKVDSQGEKFATVTGVVSDIYTKRPISNAKVKIANKQILTSADGSFYLANIPAGKTALSISKNGYVLKTDILTLASKNIFIYSPALTPSNENSIKLFGTILDATSYEPLSDVNISINSNKHTFTNTQGYYYFDSLKNGELNITISKNGYESISLLKQVLDENIEFSVNLQKISDGIQTSSIHGKVVDVANDKPLSNVVISIEGTNVSSDINGSFKIDNIETKKIVLTLTKEGYKDVSTTIMLNSPQVVDLNKLYMRAINTNLKPDIVVSSIDTANLTISQQTLKTVGDLNISVSNRGNVPTNAFSIMAFYDTNKDGNYTNQIDTILASKRILKPLYEKETTNISLHINSKSDFYEQPIYVYVDFKNENIESDENNTYSTAKSCGGKKGNIDLGVCFDYSGSVGYLADLQKQGLVQALKDADKFPRDGSVRLTIMTAYNNTYLEPTTITQDNAQSIADKINNTYFDGDSYVDDCLRYMADKLSLLPEQSSYKAVTLSGDGYWGGSIAYNRDYAISKGINVIDAIAVGSGIDYSTLNTIVYPQPSGGEFGKVYRATSSEEVSQSLLKVFRKQTKISDLTIGKLQIIDNGTDKNISIKFVAANAGSADIKNPIKFSIYEGNPKEDGVLLKQKVLDHKLSFGDFIDIQIDNIALQEGGSLYVVGDADNALIECTKENNVISSIINATTTLGNIKAYTDKLTYENNESVKLSANITNPGRLSYELLASLTIEDVNGNVIKEFSLQSLGVLSSKKSKSISETWKIENILSDKYILKANLYDKNHKLISSDKTSFFIKTDVVKTALLNIELNKYIYKPNEEIELQNTIHNLAKNIILKNTTISVDIFHDGTKVKSFMLNPQDIMPLSFTQIFKTFTFNTIGNYTLKATLKDKNSTVLSKAQTSFKVVKDIFYDIKGSVSAKHHIIKLQDSQKCTFKIVNLSDKPKTLTIKKRIFSPQNNEDIYIQTQSVNIDKNGSFMSFKEFGTNLLNQKEYICLLEAKEKDTWHTLAYDGFSVKKSFEFDIKMSNKSKYLIFIGKRFSNIIDSNGAKKQSLIQEFKKLGYSFKIVTTAKEFTKEFRSGYYNSYILFSKTSLLSRRVQRELANAVYMGENLFIIGEHNLNSSFIELKAGVKYSGYSVISNRWIKFDDELVPLYYTYYTVAPKFDDITTLVKFEDTNKTAISLKHYGKGSIIFSTFNLLGYHPLKQKFPKKLLNNLLNKAKPINSTNLYSFTTKLTNLARKIDGVVETSVDNVKILHANKGKIDKNTITWKYNFKDQNSTSMTFWVYLNKTDILHVKNDIFIDGKLFKTYKNDFEIKMQSLSIEDILTKVSKEKNKDYKWIKYLLKRAKAKESIKHYSFCVYYLLEAQDILNQINTPKAKTYLNEISIIIKNLSRHIK